MDISKGFQIEQPELFVQWDISEPELQHTFAGIPLSHITDGYFTTQCISLGGLSHELGFHFYPRVDGRLVEFEFFHTSPRDLTASYQEFQRHLEIAFGKPTVMKPGSEGYPSYTWRFHAVEVLHFVLERFGLEQHVRIKRAK
jgi:hypothetical protein